jgi:hypothetical protein
MFNNNIFRRHFSYSLLAAVLYVIPVLYFILQDNYEESYWLYIGNVFFAAGILIGFRIYHKTHREPALAMSIMSSGIKTVLLGIVIAFFLLLIILFIDIPHLFRHAGATKQMTEGPVNIISDSTKGLKFMLFINDLIGNFMAGAFISVFYTFTRKRDQLRRPAEKSEQEAG